MVLVFGLGNPGERYARTRHNAGWHVLDELARRWRARDAETVPEYRAREAEVASRSVSLVAPATWMNKSGEAFAAWVGRHGAPEDLMVLADDVYLPAGHVRLRARGSSGGHRGLESIEQAVGGREYARLRIGVGATPSAELRRHVLEPPAADEAEALEGAVRAAADVVEVWLAEGVIAAMNRFNRKVTKEVSES